MKKALAVIVLAMVAAFSICLIGCASNQQNSSSSTQTSGSQEQQKTDEELFVGVWNSDLSGTIALDGNNANIGGKLIDYTVDSDNETVTFKDVTTVKAKYQFNDDNTFVLTIDKQTETFSRISDDPSEYMGKTVDLQIGEVYEDDNLRFSINSADFVDSYDATAKGSDTYHIQEEAVDGKKYLFIQGEIMSKLSESVYILNDTKAYVLINGKTKIDAKPVTVPAPDHFLQPLYDENIFFRCSIADNEVANIESAVLVWEIDKIVDISSSSATCINVKLI